jgi:protein ImuA
MLYAAGLAALGIDPGRLLIVDSPSPGQRLAALEDILRTSGLAAVVMEYDGVRQSGDYWMRLARRAQLAAEASGVTGFLTGWPVAASGFETQWRIAPAATPVATDPSPPWSSPCSPCWQVELLQARGGRPHATRLCWQSPDNRFRDLGPSPVEGEAAAPPLPLGAPPGGLPRRIVGRRPAMTPRATLAGRLAG